jgi:hypothetical protein
LRQPNQDCAFEIYRTAQNQIVITLNYRDRGAARIAYGCETIADPSTETATHHTSEC